jgi:glycosyltransferase involved in cell wall biosynthesis
MEKKTLPLVSIGIPTYNGSARLHKPISSVWAQNYPNLEVIVSDNCSTDNTREVLESIAKEHPEIRYIRQEKNLTQIPNYEFLLKVAKGKYFMWLADDDFLEPGVIARAVEFMEDHDDYSLGAGQIQYWHDTVRDLVEGGFTFEQSSPAKRVVGFYSKVIYCGIMHGLIRTDLAREIPIRKLIGNDYHFVANLAYLGKIKNFDFVSYNKKFGGVSQNFHQYAKHMGESRWVGYFPHIKLAIDAFHEVWSRSSVFSARSPISRMVLGLGCSLGVLYCYYGRIFIGARVKNHIITPITSLFKKPSQKASL